MKAVNISSEHYRRIGLIAFSALLLVLSFPSINIELLAWVGYVPLFMAIRQQSLKNAFWLGWGAGVMFFVGTLYWVTVVMAVYGNLPIIASAGLLVIMAIYLSLYFGAFCMIVRYLQDRLNIPLVVSAPVAWTALEYTRTYFLLGFPWNLLGYSQFLTPSVTQIADITGVYGVSFLIILVNAGVYTCLLSSATRREKIITALITIGCLGVCVGYGLATLSADNHSGSQQASLPETVKVAVVQGNIEQGHKWDETHRQRIFETYLRLSEQTLQEQPDLIVWPETAAPFVFQYDPSYRTKLINAVQQWQTPLLFGGQDIVLTPPPKHHDSLNSAFLLSAQGELVAQYDKMHLVPFGEYIPFKEVLFFVKKMVEVIGEVLPGQHYVVMPFHDTPFSTVICFEIIFPNLVRKFVDRGASFLVTITNDAWYGRSAAPYQHFAMATFRAIENRVSIARAANTGISGFIDPYGHVLEQSDIFVEDALVHAIPMHSTKTVYTRYGDVLAIICVGLTILGIGWAFAKRRTAKSSRKTNDDSQHL